MVNRMLYLHSMKDAIALTYPLSVPSCLSYMPEPRERLPLSFPRLRVVQGHISIPRTTTPMPTCALPDTFHSLYFPEMQTPPSMLWALVTDTACTSVLTLYWR